jgi:hypothetical protein
MLLAIGFALTTLGLLKWQQTQFDLTAIWPLSGGELTAHPVYALVLGLALIPPTLWEIFILENQSTHGKRGKTGRDQR